MKKLFTLLFLLTMALAGIRCSESDPEGFQNIQIPAEELDASIAADELNHTISFNATQSWTASVQETTRAESWITIYPTSGEAGENRIEVTLTENTGTQSREATITIVCGGEQITITITQRAVGEPDPDPDPNEPQRPEFPEVTPENRLAYIEIAIHEYYNQNQEYTSKHLATLAYDDQGQLYRLGYYTFDEERTDRLSSSDETTLEWSSEKISTTNQYMEIGKNNYGISIPYRGEHSQDYQLSAGGLITSTTDPDGGIQRFTYNTDGTLASSTFTDPYDPEENYQTTMTWQDGNLMSIQTTGSNKDQGSATFTYTEYSNPWAGIDVGAIAFTELEEVNLLIGSCGITSRNLPASRTEESEVTTYEYTFDGEGRVSTIAMTTTDGGDRSEYTYTLHYGSTSVPSLPDYIPYLTKQEIVDEGTLPYTFDEETPDQHSFNVNSYTSYATIRSTLSDGTSGEQTEYRTISIWPMVEGSPVLEYIFVSQEDIDNFGIVSTSLQEIDLGEGVINPHRFVYTIQYNCFSVDLVAEVYYPSCTIFNTETGLTEEHMMPMIPLTKECFTLQEPVITRTSVEPEQTEYQYEQIYLFQINQAISPTESDYQQLLRNMYVKTE